MPKLSVGKLAQGIEFRMFGGAILSGRGGSHGRESVAGTTHGGPHPCDSCHNAARCREGLACAALQLFVATGRINAVAPRQPNAHIFARLFR
jgi:hypothetical protein